MLDQTGGAVGDAADEGPRSVENAFEGKPDKVLDAIADYSSEPSRAADQVQAADDPASPEQCTRDVVASQALAERVVGGYQVLPLERGEAESRLEKQEKIILQIFGKKERIVNSFFQLLNNNVSNIHKL